MVKVSGKQYGAHHLSEHFDYVARHGKLAVRSSEGEIIDDPKRLKEIAQDRSEEHTSELQSLMRISYAVFCLKKKTEQQNHKLNNKYKIITQNHIYERNDMQT